MPAGFLYVLVNSSMPGLVKVGKTTRTPSERVNELSGVTGVPTQFIVAYEEHFSDCDAAEQFVHTKLTQRGVRISDSREFFRAPVSDVVKIIASIPSSLALSVGVEPEKSDVSRNPYDMPWYSILESAEDFYYGHGDNIQNYDKAFTMYQDAARLGSLYAVERLGDMYFYGEAVRENKPKAIGLYIQNALNGYYYSYAALAIAYLFTEEHDNSLKAAVSFVKNGETSGWDSCDEPSEPHLSRMFQIISLCATFRASKELQPRFIEVFDKYIDLVLSSAEEGLKRAQRLGIASLIRTSPLAIQAIKSNRDSHPASVGV